MMRVNLNVWFKIMAFLLMAVIVAAAGRSLYIQIPGASSGRFAHRANSYLPNLAELGPEILKNPKEADRYLAYYHLIDRDSPGLTGVQEMLAYCYYYSGNAAKGIEYYEKALHLNPEAFAAWYDLGVIYFLKSDFEKAQGYFQGAVSLAEPKVLSYQMNSKVFSQLRVVQRLGPVEMVLRSRRQFDDAKRYIRLCMEKQGKPGELIFLAARYNDLRQAWSQNGGQPTTRELIVF